MYSSQPLDVSAQVAGSIVPAVLEVIGQRWSLALIHALLLQEKTFGQLLTELQIPRSTLAARLKHLQSMGCLQATTGGYQLSAAGQALMPVIILALAWDSAVNPQQVVPGFIHRCGQALTVTLCCMSCHAAIRASDIELGVAGEPPDLSHLPKAMRRSRAEFSADLPLSAAEILGDRWTALIVALGFYGVQRYSDIARQLNIAPNILADRLLRLCQGGVLRRETETPTERAHYQLTVRGLALFPLIAGLIDWGDRWLRPQDSQPTLMRHAPCAERLQAELVCQCCNAVVTLDSLSPV